MSVISSLMLLQSDPRTEAGLQFGFEREGARVRSPASGQSVAEAFEDDLQLVVVGGKDRQDALTQLSRVRGALAARNSHVPVLYVGNGVSRDEAIEEGASEVIEQPTFVRDVITIARFLCSPVKRMNSALTGELSDHFGLFYMVRALSTVRRQGVLTLIRGLRRGELRFYDGEVTSAQVGVMHGLAAMHQLLLWTDARFELRPENVVRRQQIPLSRAELITNSEKFLSDIREVAEGLSPSAVYQQSVGRAAEASSSAPDEVQAVLKLFDGSRTIADVIEDSQFRVFETLRIANRLKDFGAIEKKLADKPRVGARAALSIEEWLVDSGPTPRAILTGESEPIGPPLGEPASPPSTKRKKRKKKKRRDKAAPAAAKFDWSSLIPDRPSGLADGDRFSQVVPSSSASGEIGMSALSEQADRATRDKTEIVPPAREKLEEVVDKAKLQELFGRVDNVVVEEPAAVEARKWQVDTEPLSEDDLEEVAGEEEAIPKPATTTASGEIGLPEMPKFLRLDAADEHAADEHAAAEDAAAKDPIANDVAGREEVPALDESDADGGDDDADFEDVHSGVIDTAELDAVRAKSAGADLSLKSVELSGGETTSGEISSSPKPARKTATSGDATTASGEIGAETVHVEVAPVEVAPPAEPPAAEPRRRRPSTSPPEIQAQAKTTARDAAAAVESAVRHRPPSESGRARSESDATAPASKDARKRGATEQAGDIARAAAKAAEEVAVFTDAEEAFFSAGAKLEKQTLPEPETFEDLDEDYEVPKTFWQRLMSRPDEAPQSKKRRRPKK